MCYTVQLRTYFNVLCFYMDYFILYLHCLFTYVLDYSYNVRNAVECLSSSEYILIIE